MISVVIPTHNPNRQRFARTLAGLASQKLNRDSWELVIIDNASQDSSVFSELDFSWQPCTRIIREDQLGLTPTRIRGVKESAGEYIIFVDDDNVLDPEYLRHFECILASNPKLGAIGGKSVPEFEAAPPPWVKE